MTLTYLTESDLDRVFRWFQVVDSHLVWIGPSQVKIGRRSFAPYRVVWAAVKNCPLEEVPKMVQGCGFPGCVEPDHRAEGPCNAYSAGWTYNFDDKQWYCKRNHPVEDLGCIKCSLLSRRERYKIRGRQAHDEAAQP